MRVLLGAAVAVLLSVSSAAAQTDAPTACPAPPPMPTLPDGASANRAQMDAANVAFTAWAVSYRNNLQCRRAEAEVIRQRWQARVAEHNALADSLNAQHSAWEAEVAEFNARTPRRPASGD